MCIRDSHRLDRIAQLLVQRVERVAFREVTALPASDRGSGGYGSTGDHRELSSPAGTGPAPSREA